MTANETIDGIQEIINRNQKTILPRVHIGYLIHAVKYLKEQKEEIEKSKTNSTKHDGRHMSAERAGQRKETDHESYLECIA